MKITVIASIFGNLEVVKECMDSWFPLPKNWDLIVYNNQVSDIDGTSEYVRKKQEEYKFLLIEDGKTRRHPEAINMLINKCQGEWILHLDSDAKLIDSSFYERMERYLEGTSFKVWGRIHRRVRTDLKEKSKSMEDYFLYMIRAHQWILMFDKKFVNELNLDFGDFYGNLEISSGCTASRQIDSTKNITIFADTGWRLYWESAVRDLFGRFPDEVFKCWEHKNNASCRWYEKNKDKIGKINWAN